MIWNAENTADFTTDIFSGMTQTFPERWETLVTMKNSGALARRDFDANNTAVIVSGGAGNGPLFPGYVAKGMADAAVIGGPYSAPNAYAIYEAAKKLGSKKGVLLLYNNFAGDYLNNDMAAELLNMDGVPVESVICRDDIGSAPTDEKQERGGRCAIAYMMKLASFFAAAGEPPKQIANRLERALMRSGTISAHVNFEKNIISYGAGFSGEEGTHESGDMSMKRCAEHLCGLLLNELRPDVNERLFVMVNRLRCTSYADGYIFAKHVYERLAREYRVEQLRTANFSNILDVYGFSLTLLCAEEELLEPLGRVCTGDGFIL